MNFKLIVGTTLSLCAAFSANAQVKFDDSFNKASWRKSVAFIHPNFQYSTNKTTQGDGSVLRYKRELYTSPGMYNGATGYMENQSTSYFVVIDYPGEGFYYGFAKAADDGTMIPLFGAFAEKDKDLQMAMGYTPSQWKKMSNQKPNFKDEKDTYIPETPFSPEYTVHKSLQFLPTGIVTFTASTNYTSYAPQEIAGEQTTRKRVGGRMRSKSTTQLTGGWYFDIKGKTTVNGRWKVVGDSLKITFSKPVTTVTSSYNEKALVNRWKKEDERKYIPFELDTYRRQYMAQARADYPNYKVSEEKDAVKEMLNEQIAGEGLASGSSIALKLYGMNKNEIMAATATTPVIFSGRRDARYATPAEIKNIFQEFIGKNNAITDDEMECRRQHISKQILSTDCPVISRRAEDGFVCHFNSDNNSATYYVASLNENGKCDMYQAKIPFAEDKTNIDKEKFAANFNRVTDLDNVKNEFNNNEARLVERANDKKCDKDLRKQAKKYLSQTKNMALPTSDFNNYESYLSAIDEWKERLALQHKFLAPVIKK